MEGGREGRRKGGREGGREGRSKGGREGGREEKMLEEGLESNFAVPQQWCTGGGE